MMKRRAILAAGTLMVCHVLPATAGATDEAAGLRKDGTKVHVLSFSNAAEAARLVLEPCRRVDAECRVDVVKDSVLSVYASDEAQAKVADLLGRIDLAPRSQTFDIKVLAAAMEGRRAVNPPAGAARALGATGGLLPYKDYRLVEQGLLTTTSQGRIALGDPESGFEAKLSMVGGGEGAAPLFVRAFELVRARWEQVGEHQVRRTVVETSFTIRPGETVVLGASRLDGSDEALVVLITAVPEG